LAEEELAVQGASRSSFTAPRMIGSQGWRGVAGSRARRHVVHLRDRRDDARGAATALDALGGVIRAGSVAPELLTAPERVVPLRPARR
jgi:hypothetical protein